MTEQPDIVKSFFEKSKEFMAYAVAKFPEDVYLPIAKAAVDGMTAENALGLYYSQFDSFNDRLMAKDETVVEDIAKDENLAVLEISSKFASMTAEDRDFFWVHMTHIAKLASMQKIYKHIPTNVMASVTEAALDLKEKMESGTLDPTKINPFELGQEVMAKFEPAELEKLMKNLLGNKEAMNAMMSQMSSMIGVKADMSSPETIAALASKEFDISKMIKMMPK
jgi:hypothetical protein